MEQKKFLLDIGKIIVYHESSQKLMQVCREIAKYPSLKILMTELRLEQHPD